MSKEVTPVTARSVTSRYISVVGLDFVRLRLSASLALQGREMGSAYKSLQRVAQVAAGRNK